MAKKQISERAKDPMWVKVCQMWDLLSEGQKYMVVLAMQAMTENKEEKNNGKAEEE